MSGQHTCREVYISALWRNRPSPEKLQFYYYFFAATCGVFFPAGRECVSICMCVWLCYALFGHCIFNIIFTAPTP